MAIFVTSDTHFDHSNIIRYCNRPFTNAQDMNNAIIKNWNSLVTKNDTVWFLGDLCFPKKKRDTWLSQLNGNIIWIRGNHDSILPNNKDLDFIKVNEYQFVLCHYPMLSWRNKSHGSIMLFGHSHGTMNACINTQFPGHKMMDVGVDNHNFYPISLDSIIAKMNKKV